MTYDEGIHVAGGSAIGGQTTIACSRKMEIGRSDLSPCQVGSADLFHPPSWGMLGKYPTCGLIADQFFYEVGNDADTLLARSRLMMAVPSAFWRCWSTFGRVGCSDRAVDSSA